MESVGTLRVRFNRKRTLFWTSKITSLLVSKCIYAAMNITALEQQLKWRRKYCGSTFKITFFFTFYVLVESDICSFWQIFAAVHLFHYCFNLRHIVKQIFHQNIVLYSLKIPYSLMLTDRNGLRCTTTKQIMKKP